MKHVRWSRTSGVAVAVALLASVIVAGCSSSSTSSNSTATAQARGLSDEPTRMIVCVVNQVPESELNVEFPGTDAAMVPPANMTCPEFDLGPPDSITFQATDSWGDYTEVQVVKPRPATSPVGLHFSQGLQGDVSVAAGTTVQVGATEEATVSREDTPDKIKLTITFNSVNA